MLSTPILRNRLLAGVVIITLAIIGVIALSQSRAATPSLSFSAADGTLSGGATLMTDNSVAGGRAVKFAVPGAAAGLPPFLKQASSIATFLAPGVKPPTNQWFSNFAFKQPSDVVFAYPFAMQTLPTGFGTMYPKVVSTEKTVFGSYAAEITANFGAVNTRMLGYDDMSVVMQARDGAGATVAEYRLTQGSPVIYITLKAGKSVTLSGPTAPAVAQRSGYYSLDIAGHTYVSTGNSAVTATATGNSVTYRANSDGRVAIGVLPSGLSDTAGFIAEMQDPLTGTVVGYGTGTTSVSTSFSFKSVNNDGALMAILPIQQSGGTAPGTLMGTYATILGTLKLYKASTYTFQTPTMAPPTTLDVSRITAAEKTEIVAALTTDINNLSTTGFSADDTYFGGKQLARAANMLTLARQLGQPALAQSAYDKLMGQMDLWLNPDKGSRATKYFYYDTNLKGLVGVRPSFGSDTEFNDHHFHYGYFVYAAGIMADYNPAFVTKHGLIINTLIRDIANPSRTDEFFPYLRPFDQYAGHSWASGTSPFVDGNNNESSSEAVNAWYGLYLWGKSSGNANLETLGRWLYGRESHSALAYWTNFDRSQSQFVNYKPSVVSMVWGGKMDYGTWFSPSSYAKLGIQLLPMTPGSNYLAVDPGRVATNLTNLNDGSAPMFTDVMAMYRSYTNPATAVTEAKALPATSIDDGNSRSWLLAWVYSH
jgi:hypothetical protein